MNNSGLLRAVFLNVQQEALCVCARAQLFNVLLSLPAGNGHV